MARSKPYRLHALAWQEIEAGDDWYRQRSLDASVGFIAAVSDALESISDAPRRWPKYLYGTRRFVLDRFPSFIWIVPTS
jgi:plasmid stabilization system protein ParE